MAALAHPFGDDLPARVAAVYASCLESGDVISNPSTEWERDLAPSEHGVVFRVRCVPARAHKPAGGSSKDPFRPPYGANLVASASDSGKDFVVLINYTPIEARAMLLLCVGVVASSSDRPDRLASSLKAVVRRRTVCGSRTPSSAISRPKVSRCAASSTSARRRRRRSRTCSACAQLRAR